MKRIAFLCIAVVMVAGAVAFTASASGNLRSGTETHLTPEQVEKLLSESFVAGPPTNVQFMVKDAVKYASTGGWGFAQFDDGKPADEATQFSLSRACQRPRLRFPG